MRLHWPRLTAHTITLQLGIDHPTQVQVAGGWGLIPPSWEARLHVYVDETGELWVDPESSHLGVRSQEDGGMRR